MATPLQSYNNLLTMCSNLWTQVKASNIPAPVDINIHRAIKTLAELGATLATNTTIANLTTAQLKECKTVLEKHVDAFSKATLCFTVGSMLLGIAEYHVYKTSNPEKTHTQKTISKALLFLPIPFFAYGLYRITTLSSSATHLLNKIEKIPTMMNETIKQVESLRNTFLAEGLYKTF